MKTSTSARSRSWSGPSPRTRARTRTARARSGRRWAPDERDLRTGLAHRPLSGRPLARPLGTGGGRDPRLRRQELVADPRRRRSALLPPVIALGEPLGLRALLVLGGNREGARRLHRPLRHSAAAQLAHPARRRVEQRSPASSYLSASAPSS